MTADKLGDDVGVRGPKGERGPAGEDATSLWAFVASDGEVTRGSGAVNARNVDAGDYRVTFKQDVSGCSYQVTPGFVNVVTGASDDKNNVFGVEVHTGIYEGGSGDPVLVTPVNSRFHIAVFC